MSNLTLQGDEATQIGSLVSNTPTRSAGELIYFLFVATARVRTIRAAYGSLYSNNSWVKSGACVQLSKHRHDALVIIDTRCDTKIRFF